MIWDHCLALNGLGLQLEKSKRRLLRKLRRKCHFFLPFFFGIQLTLTMVGGAFHGMVPPSSITGQIEAKVRLETSSLDAFIVQLLEGLQRMESVSSFFPMRSARL